MSSDELDNLGYDIESLAHRYNELKAKRVAAKLAKEDREIIDTALKATFEAIDRIGGMETGGDPVKERIARRAIEALDRAHSSIDRVASGQLSAEERRKALEESAPFSETSSSSNEPSANGQQTAIESQAKKRGPGRPPGSKNKPKTNSNE